MLILQVKAALNKTKGHSSDDYIWIASDGWAQFDTDPGLSMINNLQFFNLFINRGRNL